MRAMDRSVGWRAALLQALLVAVAAVAIAVGAPLALAVFGLWCSRRTTAVGT
jgi:hypothetical protein